MWRSGVIRKVVIAVLTLAAAWSTVELFLVIWLGSKAAPHPLYYISPAKDWSFGYHLDKENAMLDWCREASWYTSPPPYRHGWLAGFGFQWGRLLARVGDDRREVLSVFCPSFFAPPLLALYPALAFIRGPLRRHRRRKHGLCEQCSYNLTGNTSGVCPECGTQVETGR